MKLGYRYNGGNNTLKILDYLFNNVRSIDDIERCKKIVLDKLKSHSTEKPTQQKPRAKIKLKLQVESSVNQKSKKQHKRKK